MCSILYFCVSSKYLCCPCRPPYKTFETKNEKQKFRRTIRHKASVKNKENVVNWQRAKGSVEAHELREEIPQTNDATSNVPEEGEQSEIIVETNHEINDDDGSNETSEEDIKRFIPHQTLYTADQGLGPNICRKIK